MIPVLENSALDESLLKSKEDFVAFFIYYNYNFVDVENNFNQFPKNILIILKVPSSIQILRSLKA